MYFAISFLLKYTDEVILNNLQYVEKCRAKVLLWALYVYFSQYALINREINADFNKVG